MGRLILVGLVLLGCQVGCQLSAEPRRQYVVALQNELHETRQQIGRIEQNIGRIQQHTSNYDAWAQRIQQIMPWLPVCLVALPLSYVSGKLLWIAGKKAIRKCWAARPIQPES